MRTQLARASAGTRFKKILRALLACVLMVALSAVLPGWCATAGFAFSAFIFLALIHGAFVGRVAPCPSCGAPLGANSDGEQVLQVIDEATTLRCESCGEYLALQKGEVRLLEPSITERPTFKSRMFENGKWPDGCALCGDHATRTENSGGLKEVPYCGAHSKAVIYAGSDDGKSMLQWRSLAMLRKYLATNRELVDQPMAPSRSRHTLIK